jgi:hypothetical protein
VLRPAALLALLVPAVASASHGRLQLELYAGGGLASDLFVGAGLGQDGLWELQPAARLDLSLSPEWKGAARLSAGHAAFTSSGFRAESGAAELEARWLGRELEGSLSAAAEGTSYSAGAPLDPAVPTSPTVTRNRALRVAPLLRWTGLGLSWRLALPAAWQRSGTAAGDVAERDLALLAGAAARLGAWSLAASYRLQRAESDRADFTGTSHGLFATAGRPLGPVELEGQLQGLALRSGDGRSERLLRAGLSARWPLAEGLALEAVYSFAGAWSDQAAAAFAWRHLATLGLRGRLEATSW